MGDDKKIIRLVGTRRRAASGPAVESPDTRAPGLHHHDLLSHQPCEPTPHRVCAPCEEFFLLFSGSLSVHGQHVALIKKNNSARKKKKTGEKKKKKKKKKKS